MSVGLIAALITAGVLGLWFPSTRVVAVAAIALLAFLIPSLAVVIFIGAAVAFYLFRIKP